MPATGKRTADVSKDVAVPSKHEPAVPARGAAELPHEPRLADARLSHQRDHLARARCRCSSARSSSAISAARPTKGVRPRVAITSNREWAVVAPMSSYASTGLASPLTAVGPRACTRMNPSASARVAGAMRMDSGPRQLLHPRRQVGRPSHRAVVHAQVAADRAHDDLPGVEADPHLQRDARGPARAIAEA